MNPDSAVEIIDRDGWRKVFPLARSIIHMGSDPRSDIVLEASRGSGVAARQLQLIEVRGERVAYRAINLGDTPILLPATDDALAPRSAMELVDGTRLLLGDFTLTFHLGTVGATAEPMPVPGIVQERPDGTVTRRPIAPAPRLPKETLTSRSQSSASIGLKLLLPQNEVKAESALEGLIAVKNLGSEQGVQFRLDVEGLEPDFYEIGPGPILFPNVEKSVYFRIVHPGGPGLLAGEREIGIRAAAPDAYPGETVTVRQVIRVLPCYRHALELEPTS